LEKTKKVKSLKTKKGLVIVKEKLITANAAAMMDQYGNFNLSVSGIWRRQKK
jgi:hypothetical protein